MVSSQTSCSKYTNDHHTYQYPKHYSVQLSHIFSKGNLVLPFKKIISESALKNTTLPPLCHLVYVWLFLCPWYPIFTWVICDSTCMQKWLSLWGLKCSHWTIPSSNNSLPATCGITICLICVCIIICSLTLGPYRSRWVTSKTVESDNVYV